MWIEVKGWMKERNLKLIRKMYENYPNENIKILDSKGYKMLTKIFKDKIENWE